MRRPTRLVRFASFAIALPVFAAAAVRAEGAAPSDEPYMPSLLNRIAFTPDGGRILATGPDRTASLWNVGEHSVELAGCLVAPDPPETPDDRVMYDLKRAYQATSVHPSGERCALAGTDGTVELWDLGAEELAHVLQGHEGRVHDLAYSPDGARLASAGEDGSVRVWNADAASEERVFADLAGAVLAVVWSPDGKLLAATNAAHEVIVWDASTGEIAKEVRAPASEVEAVDASMAFHPHGKMFAVGYVDEGLGGQLLITYLEPPPQYADLPLANFVRHVRMMEPLRGVQSVAFTTGGAELVTLNVVNTVCRWDPATWRPTAVLRLSKQLPGHNLFTAAIAPDGKRLGLAGGRMVAQPNAETGKLDQRPQAGLVLLPQ